MAKFDEKKLNEKGKGNKKAIKLKQEIKEKMCMKLKAKIVLSIS